MWVSPTTADVSEFGYARGRVASIGQIPISDAGIDSLLENPARLSRVAELGPVIHVVVELVSRHDRQRPELDGLAGAAGPRHHRIAG